MNTLSPQRDISNRKSQGISAFLLMTCLRIYDGMLIKILDILKLRGKANMLVESSRIPLPQILKYRNKGSNWG